MSANSGNEGERERFSVLPTIYVGLGGTGKEVLLRIRRHFFLKYRTATLPSTRFIWADTDAAATTITKNEDVLDRVVGFSADEVVNLSVSPTDLNEIYRNPGANHHIFEWYSDTLKGRGLEILQHGAGQNRSAGRLAFWQNIASFQQRLTTAETALGDQTALRRQMNDLGLGHLDPSPQENFQRSVVLVASLAGGTGSGSFIDAAFYIRHRNPNVAITAMLFLPGVFETYDPNHVTEIRANGYAALKELNLFVAPPVGQRDSEYRQHEFRWFPHEPAVKVLSPFNQVFLVDGRNPATNPGDKREIFQAVADVLTLEFEPASVAGQKKSDLSNLIQDYSDIDVRKYYAGNELTHAIKFRRKYAAFGIGGIAFDHDRLRNGAAYHFAGTLCKYWLGEFADIERQRELYRNRAAQILSPESAVGDLLRQGGATRLEDWAHHVDDGLKSLRAEIARIGQSDDFETQLGERDRVAALATRVTNTATNLYASIRNQLLGPGGPLTGLGVGAVEGTDIKLIRTNAERLVDTKKAAIHALVIEFLTQPDQFGVTAARAFLTEFVQAADRLRLEATAGEAEIPQLALPAPNVAPPGDLDDLFRKYQDASEIWSLLPPYRGVATRHYEALLSSALQGFLGQARARLLEGVESAKAQILVNVRLMYARIIRDVLGDTGVQKLFDQVADYAGQQQREDPTDLTGKRRIRATGLQLTLDAFVRAVDGVQTRQKEFFDGVVRTEEQNRIQSLDADVNWTRDCLDHLRSGRRMPRSATELDVYRQLSNEFFSSARIVPAAPEKLTTATLNQTDAMAELFRRSSNAQGDSWTAVVRALEGFCFEVFAGFKEDDDAIRRLANDPNREGRIRDLVANSLPWTTLSAAGRRFPAISHAYLLVPRRSASEWSDTRADVETRIKTELAGHKLSGSAAFKLETREYGGGSILLNIQLSALPSYYFGSLADYKRAYEGEMAKDESVRCSRHTHRRWERFPDVLAPEDGDAWLQIRTTLELLLECIVLGLVDFSPQAGFTYHREDSGVARPNRLGFSLDASIEYLTKSPGATNSLGEQRDRARAAMEGNIQRVFQLAKAYQRCILDVFPLSDDAGESANMRNLAARKLLGNLKQRFRVDGGNSQRTDTEVDEEFNMYLRRTPDTCLESIDYQDYDTSAPLVRLKDARR